MSLKKANIVTGAYFLDITKNRRKSPQKEKVWGSLEEIIGVGTMFLALALYAGLICRRLMGYLGFGTATVLVVNVGACGRIVGGLKSESSFSIRGKS